MGLNFSEMSLSMYVLLQNLKNLCSILCIFGKTWHYIVMHDFNLTYYSSIILGSFSILLLPKLCWHIGLTPTSHHNYINHSIHSEFKIKLPILIASHYIDNFKFDIYVSQFISMKQIK